MTFSTCRRITGIYDLFVSDYEHVMILTHSLICWYSLGVKSKNIYQRVVNVCRKIVGVK